MPAYDFRCNACGEIFEVVRRLTESGEVSCPTCSGDSKRLYSPVGVVFKGSGFHNTDYRSKPKEGGDGCTSSGSKDACASCPAAAE